MSADKKTSFLPYAIIALLCLVLLAVLNVSDELKAQRTPEQIAAVQDREQQEKAAKEYMDAEAEKQMEIYRETPWKNTSPSDYPVKFIAEGYSVVLFSILIILIFPVLYRKLQ